MKDILKIMTEEFGDKILDVNEADDEIIIYFEEGEAEVKIDSNRQMDVYRRYVYCDDDEEDIASELEAECVYFQKLLMNEFKEIPKVFDDSCMGCPAVDEIVGYFNKEFDIDFIWKFVNV